MILPSVESNWFAMKNKFVSNNQEFKSSREKKRDLTSR